MLEVVEDIVIFTHNQIFFKELDESPKVVPTVTTRRCYDDCCCCLVQLLRSRPNDLNDITSSSSAT